MRKSDKSSGTPTAMASSTAVLQPSKSVGFGTAG